LQHTTSLARSIATHRDSATQCDVEVAAGVTRVRLYYSRYAEVREIDEYPVHPLADLGGVQPGV